MGKREIAVVVHNENFNINAYETIDCIKQAGYKNVFIQWYDANWSVSQEEQVEYIKKNNLNIIFAHLGYQDINDIWLDNNEGEILVERYKNDIKKCSDYNIPMVVMHLVSKSIAPKYNEIGLKRIKKIVEYAKSINMKIAFENTKISGYLEYVLDEIKDENVGICFDIGHFHAHFNDIFDFNRFKNRIFAVHLHDNDGTSDQHLLPFDGTINWLKIMKELKENNYDGPVTLEICYHDKYLNNNPIDFYKTGYQLGEKIRDLLDK